MKTVYCYEQITCYVPLTLHEKWTILAHIKGK
jgi:hypothetical protein